MNFIQPSIDPVIFSISFLEVRWYSLAYIFGLLIGLYMMKRLNNLIRDNLISNSLIIVFLSGLYLE